VAGWVGRVGVAGKGRVRKWKAWGATLALAGGRGGLLPGFYSSSTTPAVPDPTLQSVGSNPILINHVASLTGW
jgi:transcription elongation factor